MTKLDQALERFRDSWPNHSQEFDLVFYAPSRVNKDNPLLQKDELFFCPIRLPLTDKPDSEFSLCGIVKFYKGQIDEEAVREFKQCCVVAGASLPSNYYDMTKPYTEGNFLAGKADAAVHFLALLAKRNGFVIHPDNNDYTKVNETHPLQSPWQESICLLDEIIALESTIDAPTLPIKVEVSRSESGADKLGVDSMSRLVSFYTGGVLDERMLQAQAIIDGQQTANEKIEQLNKLIPFRAESTAEEIGRLIGVRKQAVTKTTWWKQHRRGEKQNLIERRVTVHQERSEQAGLSQPRGRHTTRSRPDKENE